MIFAQSVSTKVRGTSLEPNSNAVKNGVTATGQNRAVTRSLNESRQQIMGEFLPKVDPQGGAKSKDKINMTHYYTQNQKRLKDNQWMSGQKFMPYSSNASSMEAIANRLMQKQKNQVNQNNSVNMGSSINNNTMIHNDSSYDNQNERINNQNLSDTVVSIS